MALSEKRHRSSQSAELHSVATLFRNESSQATDHTNKIQLIFIKHSDVLAWVVFVTVNTGAFIIFTSWI